jgi:hypothetical protein
MVHLYLNDLIFLYDLCLRLKGRASDIFKFMSFHLHASFGNMLNVTKY